MYTSIAVDERRHPDGDVLRSRHRVAQVRREGRRHVAEAHVDAGTGTLDETGGALVGMYTSLTLRSDDGRPGVAYLAHVDRRAGRAAPRSATPPRRRRSRRRRPTGRPGSSTPPTLPAMDPANPDVYPLPAGLGLFIDSRATARTRRRSSSTTTARNGDLKLAKFNVSTGQFDAPDHARRQRLGRRRLVAVDQRRRRGRRVTSPTSARRTTTSSTSPTRRTRCPR